MTVADVLETGTSLLAFGTRGGDLVVLKVVKARCDEWECGRIMAAFEAQGTVRVLEYTSGAALIERLTPATSLVSLVQSGHDEQATEILSGVAGVMRGAQPPDDCTTVERWGVSFDSYLETGSHEIPPELVHIARDAFVRLAASQLNVQLLHGDLHHYNVLWDFRRGWTAIDPKGVVGELEYEIGAALRNPIEMPDLVTSPRTVERRAIRFAANLNMDVERLLSWALAQGVLSAIWAIEDGHPVSTEHIGLRLAETILELLAPPPRSHHTQKR